MLAPRLTNSHHNPRLLSLVRLRRHHISTDRHLRQQQRLPPTEWSTSQLARTPARTRREPHILSQKKASTHALRSVYLETAQSLHPVQSFNSLLTRHESKADDDETCAKLATIERVELESSFPSIYSPKDQVSPDRLCVGRSRRRSQCRLQRTGARTVFKRVRPVDGQA